MSFSAEKKVGLFFLAALLTLGIMVDMVEDWHPFEVRHSYSARFKSVIGLNIGDPVRQAGVEIGMVEMISIQNSHVQVDFHVKDGVEVREDSFVVIRQTNLLGGVFLGLEFGSPASALLPPGSEVSSKENTKIDELINNVDESLNKTLGSIGDLVEQSRAKINSMVTRLDSISQKIDEGEGTIGLLVNDPSLYHDLQGTVKNLHSLSTRLENGEGTIGRLLTDSSIYDDLEQAATSVRTITGRLERGEGTLGRLLTEDKPFEDAADSLASLRTIVTRAEAGEGTLGKLLTEEQLYEDTKETMARVRSIATKIDEGQGTVGRLVNDEDIYRDARRTFNKVEKAADGLSDSGPISGLGVIMGTLF